MHRYRISFTLPAGLVGFALLTAGCGGEDHPNQPRPPVPLEVSAKIGKDQVDVAPREFGAGPAVFTVSNQTDDVVQLAIDGPTEAVSDPIEAGGVITDFKIPLDEGAYVVTAGTESRARPAELLVGPERPSSQNDLLIP